MPTFPNSFRSGKLRATLPRRAGIVLVAASGLALAACSGGTPSDEGTAAASASADLLTPSSESVAIQLSDADGMQTVAEALKETGLSSVFDGNGSYTLLAPDDATFTALGDAGKSLTGGDDNAALAALLKEHMLPGYVTPQDIDSAIANSDGGSVELPSMAGDKLTFTKSGDTITVTAPDGSTATIDGAAMAGGESVAIPVSGLLRQVS